jgi:hypothetical protein
MKSLTRLALCAAALAAPTVALAQAPAAAPAPPPPPLAIPNPTYDTIHLEQAVNKPAAEVWAKVGKYCDIEKWMGMTCVMTSGKEGELGSVRTLNGTIIEPLVAKTPLSYTYTQPVRQGVPYNMIHGTFQVVAVTPTTSKLIYEFFFDTSMVPDQAAKDAAKQSRVTRFTAGLAKAKEIAEAN